MLLFCGVYLFLCLIIPGLTAGDKYITLPLMREEYEGLY